MPDEAWLAEVLKRPGYRVVGIERARSAQERPAPQAGSGVVLTPVSPSGAILERGQPTYRSKTEARFADQLAWRVACGEVKRWLYEPVSLRLGSGCHYRPDFLLEYVEPLPLQFVEVKGSFIRDRALDKVKAAATRFAMFNFVLATWQHQTWTYRRISAHA